MRFLVRWFVSSLGLWIAAGILGAERLSVGDRVSTILIAGFILALVNVFIKPVLVILSLPAIVVSLGLFMIVVNGLLVMIAAKLYGPLEVSNIWFAMVAGMVIGLVNWLVTNILEDK